MKIKKEKLLYMAAPFLLSGHLLHLEDMCVLVFILAGICVNVCYLYFP